MRRSPQIALVVAVVGLVSLGAQATSREERAELSTPSGPVVGTLLIPAAKRPPVVLIIAGSGPTDRDGNSAALPGKNDSLKLLAEALATSGIASLRYDKRGVGESANGMTSEREARFDQLVSHAAQWIVKLRNDGRFSTITVAGHSDGSLIGMVAAHAARADAFVSLAGVARRASDILRDQIRPALAAQADLWNRSEQILQALEAGRTVEDVPAHPAFTALYRPSVQPYLMSWFKYVPATEVARLKMPILILQGTTDIQVPTGEGEALKAAAPAARLQIVPGMNHILKTAPEDRGANLKTYSDPALPIVAAVPQHIASFIAGLRPARHPEGERRSPRAIVIEEIDGARISVEYGRPSKRGRPIWGALVPYSRWWMPGADEATTITTTEPLKFESLTMPAGEFTLYTQPTEKGVTFIINTATGVFHTTYQPERNLGDIPTVMTPTASTVELLTLEVSRAEPGGKLVLSWDDRSYSAPFVVVRPATR